MAATRLTQNQPATENLERSNAMRVTLAAGASALVERFYGTTKLGTEVITATTTYGPYTKDVQFRLTAIAGGVEMEEVDEVAEIGGAIDPTAANLPADVTNVQALAEYVGALEGGGGGASPVTVVSTSTTPYAATTSNRAVLIDASAGNKVVNLGAAATTQSITVKKVDSSANTVTVDGNGSETIDGAATAVLSTQYESISLVSNGSNWSII